MVIAMFCSKCGANVPGDAKFCVKCGTKVMSGLPAVDPSRPVAAQVAPVAHTILNVGRLLIGIFGLVLIGNALIDLGMFDDVKDVPLFDNSETIHYRNKDGLEQMLRLRMSLPEDTYAKFEQAYQNIISACVAAHISNRTTGEDCVTNNMDGRTVNQTIHMGLKLSDPALSINEKLALVR